MAESKYIVLYNPISNEGHLDSWHVLFIELLTKAGYRLIAMTSDVNGLSTKLGNKGIKLNQQLIVESTGGSRTEGHSNVDVQALKPKRGGLRQLWSDWNNYYDKSIYQGHWVQTQSRGESIRQLTTRARRWLLINIKKIIDFAYKTYSARSGNRLLSNAIPSENRLAPRLFAEDINLLVARYPGQIGLVINLYLDSYQSDHASWSALDINAEVRWAGLCITPTQEPDQGYYSLQSYRGTCFLDEAFVAAYALRLPTKRFEFLPDITETSLSNEPTKLARDIVVASAGRKVVFMGGSIGKQKNLARWYELIALCDAKQWFFVQIGRLNKNNMTEEDLAALARIGRQPPSNLYIYPEYLLDERSFNDVIALSDVIFAVYRDFARSSNMLSKAAYFKKPLLVADDGLMGRRVKQYQIGCTVESQDVKAMKASLEKLHTIPNLQQNFEIYRQDFSEVAMQSKLISFLQNCSA